MRFRTIIPVALFCLITLNSRAQSTSLLMKPWAYVDGLMSRGRIAAAGRKPLVEDPFIHTADTVCVSASFGSKSISKDYPFVQYLTDNELFDDATTLMCSDLYQPSDTLSYLRGWTFYSTKHLKEAASYFSQVPSSSTFYDKSVFYGVASRAHLTDFSVAQAALASYIGPYTDVRNLQDAGLCILQRDFSGYKAASEKIGNSHYAVTEAAQDLALQASLMESYHPKSVAVAGICSAMVPGLGKIYAGRAGEGVMSFLTVGAFGAMTAENWKKCGPTDWKTILFGSLGTICYISNIYGSCVAVKVENQNTLRGYETAVLLDIHIPLYSVFR